MGFFFSQREVELLLYPNELKTPKWVVATGREVVAESVASPLLGAPSPTEAELSFTFIQKHGC